MPLEIMGILGELIGVEFKNSESKKFNDSEKEIIDEFFDIFKNKIKKAKFIRSYYYKETSDWYPYLRTDNIEKTYRIGKINYDFNFTKLYIEGKKRISEIYLKKGDINCLIDAYTSTLSKHEIKRMRTKKSSRFPYGKNFKGLAQGDLKIITAICFDVMAEGYGHQSGYLYIPTRYMNDDITNWLTMDCKKKIKNIYFPQIIKLFKKYRKKISLIR